MYILEYQWEHQPDTWFVYNGLFQSQEEAVEKAIPWYGYGPNIFRIVELKEAKRKIIWENNKV